MDVERAADGPAILEVAVELERRVVDGALRGAREFELAARLERDAADSKIVAQADGVFTIEEGVPASAGLDTVQQRVDAVGALVGDGGERGFEP